MQLYWIRTQAPRRVMALVKYLGIDADCIELDMKAGDLRTPEYTALNPNRKAPTLVDGDVVLWEASAIMAYLCNKEGSDLWPAHNPAEQVEVLRWLSWNDQHWLPAVGPFYFEHVIKPMFQLGEPDLALLETTLTPLRKLAAILDSHLANRDFVACNRLTIADFQLASIACDWRPSKLPFEDYPNIVSWLDRLMTIPAWADPWPVTATEEREEAVAG